LDVPKATPIPRWKLLIWILVGILCLAIEPNAPSLIPPPGRMNSLPARTLWVWERPEDLRSVNPHTTALAILDATILVGRSVRVIPRHQPVFYPKGITRIAVIRVEAPGVIAPGLAGTAAGLILTSAEPGASALQIDFDARASQHAFYARLLRDVRRRMPPSLPLSITALASWCSYDDWIRGLPVDEAVPMLFRMEPDRRYAPQDMPQFRIREPLCMGSIGISTRERYHFPLAGKRVYIFPDRGWHDDLALLPSIDPAKGARP
jgi:hypothetical protein